MKQFDLTAWIYARPAECMDTPCIHANDNGHEEWQDWFHVKPFATDSIFNLIDWNEYRALCRRAGLIVIEGGL